MKSILFFLSLIFGVCYSQEIMPEDAYTKLPPKEPVITSIDALRTLSEQATRFYIMCERFGICYDLDYLQFTPEEPKTEPEEDKVCYGPSECKDPYADCLNNRCQCRKNYVQQGTKCFGLNGAICANSAQCASTNLECVQGICTKIPETRQGDQLCSNKSGMSVCWGNRASGGIPHVLCRAHDGQNVVAGVEDISSDRQKYCKFIWEHKVRHSTVYEYLQIGNKIQWRNSGFTLNEAVYGGRSEGNRIILVCQVEQNEIKYVGRLSPPNYYACEFIVGEQTYHSDTYDTLVYVR